MKSKKIISALAIALVSTIGISTITPSKTAFASTRNNISQSNDASANNKNNFKFLKNDYGDIEYTYDNDGKSYKVVEKFEKDFSHGTSNIYEKNNDGSYILSSTIETTSSGEDTITLTTTDLKTNSTKSKIINVNDVVESSKVTKNNNVNNCESPNINLMSYGNSQLTDWSYSTTYSYDLRVANYTAGAISALLFKHISKLGGAVTSDIGTLLSYAAGVIISEKLPKVYEEISVYYKYAKGTNLPRAERSYTQVYKDSSRTSKIGGMMKYDYYVNGWS